MQEEIFFLVGSKEYMFFRHNEIKPGKTSLLFVHGLGESGLCFKEVFQFQGFEEFNVIAPDLVGHGRSSTAMDGNYSYDAQVNRLERLIATKLTGDIIIIGHSLGGDLGTLLCANNRLGRIKAFVNVEGDLTQNDIFISKKAVEAEQNGIFKDWFKRDFLLETVLKKWGKKYDSGRRYYASLQFCRLEAFLQNALELAKRNTALVEDFQSEIGKMYCELPCKKIFCYGAKSIKRNSLTRSFLKINNLKSKEFSCTSHWPMIDQARRFYPFLYEFVSSC